MLVYVCPDSLSACLLMLYDLCPHGLLTCVLMLYDLCPRKDKSSGTVLAVCQR